MARRGGRRNRPLQVDGKAVEAEETLDGAPAAESTAAEEGSIDCVSIGEQVGSVLEAARAAAEQMRLDAVRETELLRAKLELEASEREHSIHEHQAALDANVARTEQRLSQLAGSLHQLAAGLTELIPAARAQAHAPADEDESTSLTAVLT
jgi:hypothetical protein